MNPLPRPEHPTPQFERKEWKNLNGTWDFAFDFGLSGTEKGWHEDASAFDRTILVPFCPESRLSGIAHTDFIPCVWYHRTFEIPEDWNGTRIFLHFGGVDYDCRAWVNGALVGRHYGGSASFCFDITDTLRDGSNDLTVCAIDDIRSGTQPSGKQSWKHESFGTHYTRVTGIWQTVWLEARPESHLESVRIVPDVDNGRFVFTPTIKNPTRALMFKVVLFSEGKEIGSKSTNTASGIPFSITIENPHLWSPDDPFLYDLSFELIEGGTVIDSVKSYAGLRKVHIEENRIFLNNEPVFLRFVLDQGYYPEGVWTAPSDDELRKDIERAMAVGFNGARLHQKVFEERFHYWADKLGYLTWGEFADWGTVRTLDNREGIHNLIREWREVVMRDKNHPSIIAWTPTNETVRGAKGNPERHRRVIQELVDTTRALDPTRPVNDSSGYVHVDTDIFTDHWYEQNPETFREGYTALAPDARAGFHINNKELSVSYNGQPFVVDEYGGTWWRPEMGKEATAHEGSDRTQSWGYGKTPESIEEVYHRIEGLTKVLTDHPHIAGFCYTQLTDVEQEQNGLYTYDRNLKFDMERLRQIFSAPSLSR